MNIVIPEVSLVVLVGASGSGESTFANNHFKPTEIISLAYCPGLVSDDENDQSVSQDAYDALHCIAEKRLKAGEATVIDATNIEQKSRLQLISLAKRYHVTPVAIVLNLFHEACVDRGNSQPDEHFGNHDVLDIDKQLNHLLKQLSNERCANVHVFDSNEDINAITFTRQKLLVDKKHECGPFDIIGDIHGCYDELEKLLNHLGYEIEVGERITLTHPGQRRLIFVGDLVDRGPKTPEVLRLVMDSVQQGIAFCVAGNHEDKLKRKLLGHDIKITHGLQESLDQLDKESEDFVERVKMFLSGLSCHYVFDDGNLIIVHAGIREKYIGRESKRISAFCMYGDTTGKTDEFGRPIRSPWANEYRGDATVVYGHTVVPDAQWVNNTICIDTGCVFGGKLTALQYPEKAIVSIPAEQIYYVS